LIFLKNYSNFFN